MSTDRFEIIEKQAGQGGFGKVDKAKDKTLERDVAIKTLDPLFKTIDETNIERFKREAKTLAALSHPNIPAIYDVEFKKEDKIFKIIYEWIHGKTIHRYLVDDGVLSLELTHKYFSNICSALSHAHAKGIIHRDIKPSNIIISESDHSCYLVDFGISLQTEDIVRLTDDSNTIGTPGYMSPEQEANEEVDSSSDIFSLGIVLYECLSGTRPSVGEYRPLNSFNEAIPPSIDSLIRDSVTTKNSRIQTADEFLRRLKLALRPSADIGKTFSQGALHEIIASLQTFNHVSFSNLPHGQKVLVLTKLRTLVKSTDFNLRNPTASFLTALIKVCGRIKEDDFELIVKNSINYGFEVKYGDNWYGNPSIRDELSTLALTCGQKQHTVLSESLLEFLQNTNFEEKEIWYLADMKSILQSLLGNEVCEEDNAIRLGESLENVSSIYYKQVEK
ncbi:serine/threonine protein kinase [Gracilimonas sp.]|uniref:serine/threonine protein kinase n=1 Tax=Gracilimonas sp. TaxID=1974203 RepID=UPI003D143C59